VAVTASDPDNATSDTQNSTIAAVPPPFAVNVSSNDSNANIVQEGDTLTATSTAPLADNVTFQWQRSTDGFVGDIENVTGIAPISGGAPASIYQVTQADEGFTFRAVVTDTTNNGVKATSAATAAVTDAPLIVTPAFAVAVDELSITKNGSQVYDDVFRNSNPSDAPPPASPAFGGTATFFDTSSDSNTGSTWSLNASGQAVMSNAGAESNGSGAGASVRNCTPTTRTNP
jgi:hypothetical protein